jgi:ComF family protein
LTGIQEFADPAGRPRVNHCLLCAAAIPWTASLCSACTTDCPRPSAACERCGCSLPQTGLCGRCLRQPPPYRRLVAPFSYRYPLDVLIQDFKYRDRLACARFFAQALAEEVRAHGDALPGCLVPVPLHWRRCCVRGFNQSLVIARLTGAVLGVAVDHELVRRCRASPPQTGLRAAARRRNLRGVFRVEGAPRWNHLAIVDDVVTTGATAREISRALIRAGVEQIEVWAIARTG